MNLTALANINGSDKGTKYGDPAHKYTYLYDLLFYNIREQPLNILEMGLAVGGPELGFDPNRVADSPSIDMWLKYFSKAKIFGFDISDFSHLNHPRFTFTRGDSGSANDLDQLTRLVDGYDIIIDDASHASYHQQLALKILFDKLKPGGLYIIEDLQWQSPFFENDLPRVPKTAIFFDEYFEKDQYIQNNLLSESFMSDLKIKVASYALFNSFGLGGEVPKLIVLRKRG